MRTCNRTAEAIGANKQRQMSLARSSPTVFAESVEAALAALRDRGLRVSAARRLVLESLFLGGHPQTAEEIAGGVAGRIPPSDLASVYRNLERLEAIGLVRHVHLGHGPGLYGLAGDEEREYLLCERCDAVQVVASDELEGVRTLIRERLGFEARFRHFPIAGLCAACAAGDLSG
jgi:Fur family ferric uptake transcriptional regulator